MVKSLRSQVFEAEEEGKTNKQIFLEFKDNNKKTVKRYICQSKKNNRVGDSREEQKKRFDEGWEEIKKVIDERNSYLRELVELCFFNCHLEDHLGKDKWKTIINEVKERIINLTDDIDYKTPFEEDDNEQEDLSLTPPESFQE